MSVRTCQYIHVSTYMSLHTCQYVHVSKYISVRSCQYVHVNKVLHVTCPVHILITIDLTPTNVQQQPNSEQE